MEISMKEWQKVILGGLVFLGMLLVADWAVGTLSKHLYYNSRYGIFHRQIYCIEESQDDVLILGSSRANHQYVSSVFADTLGLSVYNAGSEGMCVFYHYAILDAVLRRGHRPKLVVYDVMDLDAEEPNGNTFTLDAAIDRLMPHYGKFVGIDSLIALKGWQQKLTILSKTYRYNSKAVQMIKCNFLPQSEDRGYEVVKGMLPDSIEYINEPDTTGVIDSLKLTYVAKLIKLALENEVPLIMVYSPLFRNPECNGVNVIKEIARDNQVSFWDYSKEETLLSREYFRDVNHLNDDGAHVWSAFLAHQLKQFLNEDVHCITAE